MTGVLNIYKEKGYTSHDVVAILRRIAKTKKVGHTGTLDPNATGVLPVCFGRATKLADYLASADKTYIAEVIFGLETNTGDITGEVIAKNNVIFDKAAIESAVNSFAFAQSGVYMQTPPMFSAIKIGGKKLYEIARKGKSIEVPARPVTIHEIEILEFRPEKNSIIIKVKCSKGTYIRSLAIDIGKKLGGSATMGELERTQSGIFDICNAIKLSTLKESAEVGELSNFISPVDKILPYKKITLSAQEAKPARNGNPLPLSIIGDVAKSNEKFWLYDTNGIIGLFSIKGEMLKVEVML